MKKWMAFCLLLSLLMLCACSKQSEESYFGFTKNDFTVVAEFDTHGGFHGDGLYYLHLDCFKERERALELVSDWTALPLTDSLSLGLYGGEKDGIAYGFNFAAQANIPAVKNGYYLFTDRHPQSTDPADDTALFDRGSYNFSLGIYDSDTDMFYYMELDT